MKHISKILALVLALTLVLGLATAVSAADETEKITIEITTSASGASVTGHTYEVYQIFTGAVAEDGKTLTDAAYGANYTSGKTVAEAMAELETMSGPDAAAFLAGKISGEPFAVLNDDNSHKIENVDPGYYLIVDVSTGLPEGEITSAYILQALEDVVIKSKHSAGPKVEKKIDDTNDSVDVENEIIWHDSADHDIGDKIDFKLEMTVPSIIEEFKTYKEAYKFTFHDKEEAGLTFQPDTVVVKVNDTEITSGYEVIYPAADGDTFDVVFADMTKIDGLKAGDKVTVYYKSELNENAVLGSQGNVNEVYGEFSNLHRPEYPGRTPKDFVIAFTYKVIVNKVDQDQKPLAGATFTLEKYNKATDSWIAIEQVETEAGTVFTFEGLDDGDYRLTETKAPNGYNSIDPIEFTVTADHNILWEDEGSRLTILETLTGTPTTGEIAFTALESNEGLSADVINEQGVVLPETGGIGTYIFYIIGGLLAVGAVVLLVTKKRMSVVG